jgi:hypothetical protein
VGGDQDGDLSQIPPTPVAAFGLEPASFGNLGVLKTQWRVLMENSLGWEGGTVM